MRLVYRKPISELDLLKIEQIFRESQCPHESLRNTFPDRYNCVLGDLIFFDDTAVKDILLTEAIKRATL